MLIIIVHIIMTLHCIALDRVLDLSFHWQLNFLIIMRVQLMRCKHMLLVEKIVCGSCNAYVCSSRSVHVCIPKCAHVCGSGSTHVCVAYAVHRCVSHEVHVCVDHAEHVYVAHAVHLSVAHAVHICVDHHACHHLDPEWGLGFSDIQSPHHHMCMAYAVHTCTH